MNRKVKKNPGIDRNYRLWRFGTINVQTLREDSKAYEVTKAIHDANIEIVGLQEVKRLEYGETVIKIADDTYRLFWQGHKEKRHAGVGLIIKVCKYIEIEDVEAISPRIIIARLKIHNLHYKFVVTYAPTEDKSHSAKNKFYHELLNHAVKDEDKKHQKLIIMGDMNATTTMTNKHCAFNGIKVVDDVESNDNGERLIDFCREKALSISSTFFIHNQQQTTTWISPDGKTKKKLDYILCESWVRKYMMDCRAKRSVNIYSDHVLLMAKMKTPFNKASRYRPRTFNKETTNPDINHLNYKNVRLKFRSRVESTLLPSAPDTDTNAIYGNLVNTIRDCTSRTLPRKKKGRFVSIWEADTSLNCMIDEMSRLFKEKRECKDEINKLRKKIKLKKRKLINDYFKKEAEKINLNSIHREMKALFANAKEHGTTLENPQSKIYCAPDKIASFFENHFKSSHDQAIVPDELTQIPPYIAELQLNNIDINQAPPTKLEIADVIKTLKPGKSSSDIPPDVLKTLLHSDKVLNEITLLFKQVWQTEVFPKEFGHSQLVAIWKRKANRSVKIQSHSGW